jgi:outer membrane autotransporter protein
MALSIAGQTYTSFVSDLSIEIARAISLKSGVLVPQLRLSWLHEFENDQEQVGTFLINDINKVPFFVLTNEPDRDYFDLGIAVSAQFARGASGFISYNALLGYSGVNLQAVNAGVRFEF